MFSWIFFDGFQFRDFPLGAPGSPPLFLAGWGDVLLDFLRWIPIQRFSPWGPRVAPSLFGGVGRCSPGFSSMDSNSEIFPLGPQGRPLSFWRGGAMFSWIFFDGFQFRDFPLGAPGSPPLFL